VQLANGRSTRPDALNARAETAQAVFDQARLSSVAARSGLFLGAVDLEFVTVVSGDTWKSYLQ